MKSASEIKVSWTWEEWQRSRATRKAISEKAGPAEVRRGSSSADRRLRTAFAGRRAP